MENFVKTKLLSKKSITCIMIAIVLLMGCLLYFKSLRLSDLINKNQEICVTAIELGTPNGEPYMNSKSYNEITDAQKNDIISLFQNYSYRRTFLTAFSDGSLSDLGNVLVCIYTFDDGKPDNTISISTTGSISVNSKTYLLANASDFIQKLLEIINS